MNLAEIKGFGALRFTPQAGALAQLTCPPYDIISEQQRLAYLQENSHNIIRLELPKEGDNPYSQAGDTLKQWLQQNILAQDDRDGIYIYEEEFVAHGKTQTVKGYICRVRLEPLEKGVVLPHEETLSHAKTDRLNLMEATGCNFSSVYCLYFDEDQAVQQRIEQLSQGTPQMDFAGGDGVRHRVWCVYDAQEIAALAQDMADKKLYIADGHHRYETALNYRNKLQQQGLAQQPDHPANYMMMTLVSMEHPGLVVFPTHRIVHGLQNFSLDNLLQGCEPYFEVFACPAADLNSELDRWQSQGKKAFGLYTQGQSSVLVLRDVEVMDQLLPEMSPCYRQLDVTILHTLILEKLLHIDKENMARQINLRYTREFEEAIEAVDSGAANCSLLINATKVSEIAQVAGAGEKMPQKSTYFYPKLITGHVMNKIL